MATSKMTSYGIIVPASRHYFIVNAQPGHEDYVQKRVVLNPSPTQLAKIQESGDIFSVMSDGGPAYTTRSMEFTTNNGSIVNARFVDGYQVVDDQQPMRIAKFIVSVESCPIDVGKEPEEQEQQEEQGDDDDDETEEVEDMNYESEEEEEVEDVDYESEEEEEEEVEDVDYESEEEVEEVEEEEEEEDMDYESEEEVEVEQGGEGDEEGEMCVICQEEYKGGELIGALECGHEYHPKCIKKWLVKNRVCPICRFTDFSS